MNRHNPPFCPPGTPHSEPSQKNGLARSRETDRKIEISDNVGNLTYRVSFNETLAYVDGVPRTVWTTKVMVPSPDGDEVTLYDAWSDDYEIAAKDFRRNVETYENLVKTQCRHVDDIAVYADRIGYRKMVPPPCCWTCRFSFSKDRMGHCHDVNWKGVAEGKLRCHCPKIFRLLSPDVVDAEDVMDPRTDEKWLDVNPFVKPDGVCDHWEARTREDMPECLVPTHPPSAHVFSPEKKCVPPGRRDEFRGISGIDHYSI